MAPESGGGAAGDGRPAGRPEPLREGAAGHRRQSQTNFILEYELDQLAAAADQRAAGLARRSSRCSGGCRAAAPTCCSSSATEQKQVTTTRRVVVAFLRGRERRDLDARVVEAGAAAEIGQRVGHERRAGRAVARAAPPEALRQADGARPDRWVARRARSAPRPAR